MTNKRIGYARKMLNPASDSFSEAGSDSVPELWPEDEIVSFGKQGCVPVGTPVLHSPTRRYTGRLDDLRPLSERMARTLRAAEGIGLAANQVGAGLRVLLHALPQSAPDLLINPVLISSEGWCAYPEGCLSLNLPASRARVERPRRVLVKATLPRGERILIDAGDYLARVLLHEIDHLDGIEYVQRLTGDVADRVYAAMATAGIPVEMMPVMPYPRPEALPPAGAAGPG